MIKVCLKQLTCAYCKLPGQNGQINETIKGDMDSCITVSYLGFRLTLWLSLKYIISSFLGFGMEPGKHLCMKT